MIVTLLSILAYDKWFMAPRIVSLELYFMKFCCIKLSCISLTLNKVDTQVFLALSFTRVFHFFNDLSLICSS